MSDVEFLSEPYAAPPPRRPQRARWLVPVVAAAVVAGGGVGTYYALSSSQAGSDTPVAAVQAMVGDMERSDLIGLLDDMAPGERTALEPGIKSDVDNLKRLGVLAGNADPSSVRGVTISGANLEYSAAKRINSNVQIVDVDGGTLTLHGDLSKLPLSARIMKMIGSPPKASTQKVDLAKHPLHIAAQQVSGRWYWSLFYTYANSSLPGGVPGSPITPHGADSPTAAVKQMIEKLAANDWRAAIALLSPAELSAVQTYAGAALQGAPRNPTGGFELDSLQLQASPAADGYQQVTFKSLTMRTPSGKVAVTRSGDCFRVVSNGKSQHFCASQLPRLLQRMFGAVDCAVSGTAALTIPGGPNDFGTYSSRPRRGGMSAPDCHRSGFKMTPAQQTALTHLVQGLIAVGIDTQQVGGSWYVAPVRTASDSVDSVLSHLQGNDLWTLTTLGR